MSKNTKILLTFTIIIATIGLIFLLINYLKEFITVLCILVSIFAIIYGLWGLSKNIVETFFDKNSEE